MICTCGRAVCVEYGSSNPLSVEHLFQSSISGKGILCLFPGTPPEEFPPCAIINLIAGEQVNHTIIGNRRKRTLCGFLEHFCHVHVHVWWKNFKNVPGYFIPVDLDIWGTFGKFRSAPIRLAAWVSTILLFFCAWNKLSEHIEWPWTVGYVQYGHYFCCLCRCPRSHPFEFD